MTYYPHFQSEFEARTRRWLYDCRRGQTHKLDEHQTREVWIGSERRRLVLCWWCMTWTTAANVEDDMLESWSAEAKAYWKERHPR